MRSWINKVDSLEFKVDRQFKKFKEFKKLKEFKIKKDLSFERLFYDDNVNDNDNFFRPLTLVL